MNGIDREIVDAAYIVHTSLGPGLLEHVYQACLKFELERKGIKVQSEVEMPVIYKNKIFNLGYRIDLLVESQIIIELKSIRQLLPVHKAQLITYLKLADKNLGFLINFNSHLIKKGIVRVVN